MSFLARDVAVVGVGYSQVARAGDHDIHQLTLDASRRAIRDAGLEPNDVDAIINYQFGGGDAPTCATTQRLLGIENVAVYNDIMGSGPSGLAAALDATMAIASGACETALVYRCITRAAGYAGAVRETPTALGGPAELTIPYGFGGGLIQTMGMRKRRRVAVLGGSYEDYGHIAVTARKWAALNERAALRSPLTMDDYMNSRPIAEPLVVLDCDYPVNGCCAAVLTTAERARDLAQAPVVIDSMAYSTGRYSDWLYNDDFLYGGMIACGKLLWERSSLRPDDVDTAQLYDGFTHIAISWIEALGLCGIGEFHDWVDDGRRIAPGGSMPLNTSGGQLAEGRLHGLAFLCEAALQLQGRCGARQVPDARAALVANAAGPQSGAMVLRTA